MAHPRAPVLRIAPPPAAEPETSEPFVRVSGLVKRYRQVQALDGLSLEIARGEALCLLGPNGAGKTTLLHALAGLLRPDAGTVRIGAIGDPTDPHVRRSIGLVPQSLALYAQLSAAENLRFFGRLSRVPARDLEARVRFGLELAGLSSRADQRAGTLSGGMQRRLNLACALLHGPDLLLLDEPTTGVDAQSRSHLFATVERLKAQGLTVVCSTHSMDEAERLCDRVAVIEAGRVRALGTHAGLLAEHHSADLP
jgi:ABC-2 type transport system ATP-binding protein